MTRLSCLLGWAALACLLLGSALARADATIIVDGVDTGDWPDEPFYFLDNEDDMPPPWGDIQSVMVTDDNTTDSDGFLYLGIDFYNDFRDHIGSNDVDLSIYLDTDLDGVNDFAIELTEGTVTDLNTGTVTAIDSVAYEDDFVEAAIPYSVLGLVHGADQFGLYVAVEGKPDGTVEYSPEPDGGDDGYIIYDGTTGDDVEPLAVRMIDLGAHLSKNGVTLAWATGFERGNLGFFVYRQRGDAAPELLNKRFIPGLGHDILGRDYRFADPDGRADDVYWIEDVDTRGRSRLHGPLFPGQGPMPAPLTRRAAAARRHVAVPSTGLRPETRRAKPSPALAQKFAVRKGGLQRLADLPRSTGVEAAGARLPLLYQGEDVLFYAEAQVDRYAAFTPVFTTPGRPSRRMKRERVDGRCSDPIQALRTTADLEVDQNYFTVPQEGDPFTWTWSFAGMPAVLPFHVPHPVADDQPLVLSVRLIGLTAAHRVRVALNGVDLGERDWSDGGLRLARLPFEAPADLLRAGDNELTVEPAPGGDMDILYLDGFSIEYTRALVADEDGLRFVAPANACLALSGIAKTAAPILLDVTADRDPVMLFGFSQADEGDSISLRFRARHDQEAGPRTYLLSSTTAAHSPAYLGPRQTRDLRDPALQADYLVISHPDFTAAAERLAAHHQAADGLRTLVVTTEEIYDGFAHGRPGPTGIRAFLDTIRGSWEQPPRYVMLMGGATVDPKGYTYRDQVDFVPCPFLYTRDGGYEAAADSLYVSDRGQAPWTAIGRLAVGSPEEAQAVVSKILSAYGQIDTPTGRMLFVADQASAQSTGTPADFPAVQDGLIAACVPTGEDALRVYKDQEAHPTDLILAAARDGLDVLSYFGHGYMGGWSYAPTIFDGATAAEMDNARPFLLISGTCFDGAFPGPFATPLAWSMVGNPDGGAWAAAASSMTVNPTAVAFVAEQFLCRLTSGGADTLGEALRQVKTDLAGAGPELQEALDTYHLLGDPAAPNPFLR